MTTEPDKEPDTMTGSAEGEDKAKEASGHTSEPGEAETTKPGGPAVSAGDSKPPESHEHENPATTHENDQSKEGLFGWSAVKWTALATIVIAVANLGYIYISRNQLRVMTGQIEEMRSDRRPWVYADISLAAPIEFDASGMRVALKFGLHNTGREPAKYVYPEWRIYSGRVTFDVLALQRTLCNEVRARDIGRNTPGTVLFPGQEFTYLITTTMTREIIDADHKAQAGTGITSKWLNTISPIIVGCITYRPTSGHQYQTGFIYEMWDKGTDTYALSGNLVFVMDEGRIPPERISLVPSLQGGAFYAD